jgi:queuine tRNA-ribosyltransferase
VDKFSFELLKTCGLARAGTLYFPSGEVPTPAFVPVATQGSVKALDPNDLRDVGARILFGNTYHLYLRPGVDTVYNMGGLAKFMSWDGPTLTDSGGFQAYSLGSHVDVTDDGLKFRSHLDGTQHLFTPEKVMVYQNGLGADISMPLDQCIEYTEDKSEVILAMERTHRWLERCVKANKSGAGKALFGIVQGGVFIDLREKSAELVTSFGLPGYAIGGMETGESKNITYEVTGKTVAFLPKDRPRHLLGVGSPEDLVECVARGVDTFDCALPTRVARNGALYTRTGRINVTGAKYKGVDGPVDESCDCSTCNGFSIGYINHLFRSRELLAFRLATIHNLRFIMRLMEQIREAILVGSFSTFAKEFLENYRPVIEGTRLTQRKKWVASRGKNL